jgi:iron complex transport system substrate-binding protein
MEGSDYPNEARRIPRVGGPSVIDLEVLMSLKPDLVVAWASGNPPAQIAKLRSLGVPVYMSEPQKLKDIPVSMVKLGQLAGTRASAQAAALHFEKRMSALPQSRHGAVPVRVFYQIWQSPIMTVNDNHIISDVLRFCGAENVFGKESALTPTISMEAALSTNPELLVSTRATRPDEPDWLAPWLPWRHVGAVARKNFCEVNPDWMSRAGPRLIDGAEELCACVEQARLKRPVSAPPTPRR